MMALPKIIRRNPVESTLVAIGGIYLACNVGAVNRMVADQSAQREAIAKSDKQVEELQISEDTKKEMAAIAEQRYKDGAVIVVASNHRDTYTTLSEGQPVMDYARRVPLPAGTIAADAFGNTCKIVRGDTSTHTPVCGEMAFTGNQQVIRAALKKFVGAKYYVPNL